jgi:uncharacterized protein YprB with RNaseH-like and TPR domain/predicted nuclease with RNAse H fold
VTSLERTFLHFPGVGPRTEAALWGAGVRTWNGLETLLRRGVRSGALRRGRRSAQLDPTRGDPTAAMWLRSCEESSAALRQGEFGYFTDRLPLSEHWRVLTNRAADPLFLDIETTGLSHHHNQVTVIGALFRGSFYQWVWPENLDGLRRLIIDAQVVVTYNGRRFDIPFLLRQLKEFPSPRAHVDLRYIADARGYSGGQKAVENSFALRRPAGVEGVDGFEAVSLWCETVYGQEQSLKRLLAYNRADVLMLQRLATRLSTDAAESTRRWSGGLPRVRRGRDPLSFEGVQKAWWERRATLDMLLAKIGGPSPRVVGIDLRGNPENPTGWALCDGKEVATLEVYDDLEIVSLTLDAKPDIVSIDAPLALPRGRQSAFDDSPCRESGGIVRDAERVLWSRGIGVYPALIPHMQGLTNRGMDLAATLRGEGIEVIESYPGAAQDILGIPRKKKDLSLLRQGLADFGFGLDGSETHDELDAVTSAMVGYFYLANQYEGLGADDECYLIVPRWDHLREWN